MPIIIDKKLITLESQLLLSVQRALLDEIDPNLRAVKIDWDETKEIIYLYFYFDGLITPENLNSASCAAGETAGDFLPEVRVIENCIRVDSPKEIPSHKLVAFRRKEQKMS